ncbi:Beta/Gamma crystallin [Nitrosovibrio tenuis]|uniref:Beta/Gamma crystallin n=2 Tax=Nitrosovibrio tenuis TaxID=1233 RepID=A0A1H7KM40_9PROT|nr:Beta/Gamma crystallin [Nitrosovibrio tenuis]
MNILRKSIRNALVTTAVLFGLCAATGAVYAQQTGDKAKTSDKSMSSEKNKPPSQTGAKERQMIEAPVIMMVPAGISDKAAMEKGCWVKLYDKKNFNGDSLLIVGPVNLGRMIGPFGVNWENKVRSLETGPNTNLTIFDNRDFKDEDKFVDPGKQIPNLSKAMGFFDDFRSMIVSCI